MNPIESLCYSCSHYDWSIEIVKNIGSWEWKDECTAGFVAGDQVKECEGYDELDQETI